MNTIYAEYNMYHNSIDIYTIFIVSGTNVVNLSPKALIFQGYRALFFLKNF